MEQFLKNFFNDNSVCVGLCDLKRKTDEITFTYATQQQPQVQQVRPQMQKTVQQKPQKQTLAQRFAAQQQAYAAQQAYIAEQRKLYAEQLAQQKAYMAQQQANQKSQFAQHAYAAQQEMQRVVQQKPVSGQSSNPYRPFAQPNAPKSKVIVNGNMKKIVSPAVPARH